ncbi:MAG: protein-export chaperone SecB [Candidatus Adiutrix sp.]|jgi:preprotein translocase subunit SecB|nr:protein-export chaperone SecB [Candidatus Adiutrix sp.]
MKSTFQMEMAQLRLIRSVFAVNMELPAGEERIAIGVSLKNNGEFLHDGRRAHFLQSFKTSNPGGAPFFLDVEFGALFVLNQPPLPLEQPYYIRKVFPHIVFPYLREYVAETTRRGGFTPMILNHDLFENETERESGTAPAAEGEHKWVH